MPTYKQWGFTNVVNSVAILDTGAGYWNMTGVAAAINSAPVIEIDFGYPVSLKSLQFNTDQGSMGDYAIVGSNTAATGVGDAYVRANGDILSADIYHDATIGGIQSPAFQPDKTFDNRFRYYRLILVGPVTPSLSPNDVQLRGFRLNVAMVFSAFGYVTNTGVYSNAVDNNPATKWTPFASTFPTAGDASNLPDVIAAAPSDSYPAIQVDMGEPVALGFFSFSVDTSTTLSAAVLYGSNSPATSALNTLQPGDVKLGTYTAPQMNGQSQQTLAAISGQTFRYYRFIYKREAPAVVTPTKWNPTDLSAGHVALTNTNHTATATGGGNWGVRATPISRGSGGGLYYLEYSSLSGNNVAAVGLGALADTLGTSGQFGVANNGDVYFATGGGSGGNLGSAITGHTVGLAIDFVNNKIYATYDGSTWVGDGIGAADPVNNVHGRNIAGFTAPVIPMAWLQVIAGAVAVTINCGDTPFAFNIPDGFEPWAGTSKTSPDGTGVKEFTGVVLSPTVYQNADYDSIFGKGDRVANGLLTVGQSGLGSTVTTFDQSFDNDYGFAAGNGGYFGGGALQAGTSFAWFELDSGLTSVFLKGVEWRGSSALDIDPGNPVFWAIYGGLSATSVKLRQHEVDGFAIQTIAGPHDYSREIICDTPFGIPWPYFEIQVTTPITATIGRFAEEIWLKIAHSVLDGGDRRNVGGLTPDKEVLVTTDFVINHGTMDTLVNGEVNSQNRDAFFAPADYVALTVSSTAGKFIKFEFPRDVAMHRMVLNTDTKEVYSSGNPTKYGTWQWQGSADNVTWTNVGPVWKFKDACFFMLAPDPQPGNTISYPLWRMVLVTGPAFDNAFHLQQFIFDLTDTGGQHSSLRVNFTDDGGAASPVLTLDIPNGPFSRLRLSDGDSDALTGVLTLKINPVLTVAFTDDGELNAVAEFLPSMVVQTMLHVTGR